MNKQQAYKIFDLLKHHYPEAKMILQWTNNFELLVSIILSAQCTDKKVNEVTAVVFPKYQKERVELKGKYEEYKSKTMQGVTRAGEPQKVPAANNMSDALLGAGERQDLNQKDSGQARMTREQIIELVNFAFVPVTELEQDIKSTGFYHNKAKNVQAAAKTVLENFHGKLPRTITELTTIPGVGRKTANVFLGNAYGIFEGIAVDTHVKKQSQVFGFTKQANPEKIEQDLMKLFDQKDWFTLTYLLIEHGRNMRRKKSDRKVCSDPSCILCSNK